MSEGRTSALIYAGLAGVVVSLVTSATLYPGGSWADADSSRFEPFVNYWCDLMRTESPRGESNQLSLTWARVAFCCLAGTLVLFWRTTSRELSNLPLARLVLVSGLLSAACVVLLAMLPYNTQQSLHAWVTLSAGGSGFVAMALVMMNDFRSPPIIRWDKICGAGLLVAASVNVVIYVDIILSERSESAVLPVLQKIATLLLLAWIAARTRQGIERERPH